MKKNYPIIIILAAAVLVTVLFVWLAGRQTPPVAAPVSTSTPVSVSASTTASTAATSSMAHAVADAIKIESAVANPTSTQPGRMTVLEWHATSTKNYDLVWSIRFGDGGGLAQLCPDTPGASGQGRDFIATHVWTTPAVYVVTVSVKDCEGSSASQSSEMTVDGSSTSAVVH